MVTILSVTQRSKLSGSSRYLGHVRNVHRKFVEAFEKRFHLKKWGFVSIFQPWGWNILAKPYFWVETIFQMFLKSFLLTLRMCSRYLKGPPNLDLFVSVKKLCPHDTPNRSYARKSEKGRDFKNETQNEAGIFWQNLNFEMKSFFKGLYKLFYGLYEHVQGIQ